MARLTAGNRRNHPRSARIIAATAGLLLSAGLVLSGCEDRSDSVKLSELMSRVTMVTSAGQQLVAVESRRFAELRSIRDDLDALAKSDGIDQTNIKLLQARVTEQMGNVIAALASEKEQEVALVATRIGTSAGIYGRQAAMATASGKASTAEAVSGLIAEQKTLTDRAARLDGEAKTISDRAAAAQSQADGLLKSSADLRKQASAVRSGAIGSSAQAGLAAAEQAALLNRRADEADQQAAYLAAEIATLKPEQAMLTQQAKGLREAAVSVGKSATGLQARERLEKDASAEGKKLTETTATDLAALLDVMVLAHAADDGRAVQARAEQAKPDATGESDGLRDAVKDANITALTSLAERYYNDASTSTKAASSAGGPDAKKSAQGVETSIMHAKTDLMMLMARSQQRAAEVFAAAAGLQPPLAKQSFYAAQAEESGKQAAELLTAARTAYGELKEKLGSVQGIDEARAKRLGDQLDRLSKGPTAPASAPAVAPDGAAGGAASGTSVNIPPELTELLAQNIALEKTADFEGLLKLADIRSERDRKSLLIVGELLASMKRLDAACTEKLGKPFDELAKGNPMLGTMTDGLNALKKSSNHEPSDYKIVMESERRATASVAGSPTGKKSFVKVDGVWKISLQEMLTPELVAQAGMLAPIAKAMDAVTEDVKSGKIANGNALGAAFMQKMQEAMMGSMGGGGK